MLGIELLYGEFSLSSDLVPFGSPHSGTPLQYHTKHQPPKYVEKLQHTAPPSSHIPKKCLKTLQGTWLAEKELRKFLLTRYYPSEQASYLEHGDVYGVINARKHEGQASRD